MRYALRAPSSYRSNYFHTVDSSLLSVIQRRNTMPLFITTVHLPKREELLGKVVA